MGDIDLFLLGGAICAAIALLIAIPWAYQRGRDKENRVWIAMTPAERDAIRDKYQSFKHL